MDVLLHLLRFLVVQIFWVHLFSIDFDVLILPSVILSPCLPSIGETLIEILTFVLGERDVKKVFVIVLNYKTSMND